VNDAVAVVIRFVAVVSRFATIVVAVVIPRIPAIRKNVVDVLVVDTRLKTAPQPAYGVVSVVSKTIIQPSTVKT
jgi:hypothetical protein